jgi:hypothetical protein
MTGVRDLGYFTRVFVGPDHVDRGSSDVHALAREQEDHTHVEIVDNDEEWAREKHGTRLSLNLISKDPENGGVACAYITAEDARTLAEELLRYADKVDPQTFELEA